MPKNNLYLFARVFVVMAPFFLQPPAWLVNKSEDAAFYNVFHLLPITFLGVLE